MQESLYDTVNRRSDSLLHRGFDYNGQIFNRTLSPVITNDPRRASILQKFENVITFLIEKTKMIKNTYNYTVDKEYTKIR